MPNILDSIYAFLTTPGDRDLSVIRLMPFHGALLPYLLISVFYVLFVFKIGPAFMKNRQPYKLTSVLRYYNIGQIIYNAIISCLAFYLYAIKRPMPITCINPLPNGHPLKDIEGFVSVLYALNKFIDYFDTIFFVLRKSYKQITFLHVYHHIMMSSLTLLYVKYLGGGGHAASVGILNTFVHVIMYAYYLASATRPEMKNSLWWKKYVTKLQLVQFVVLLIHQTWPLVVQTDCDYPRPLLMCATVQAVLMICLFSNFYYQTYIKSAKKKGNLLDAQEAKER